MQGTPQITLVLALRPALAQGREGRRTQYEKSFRARVPRVRSSERGDLRSKFTPETHFRIDDALRRRFWNVMRGCFGASVGRSSSIGNYVSYPDRGQSK